MRQTYRACARAHGRCGRAATGAPSRVRPARRYPPGVDRRRALPRRWRRTAVARPRAAAAGAPAAAPRRPRSCAGSWSWPRWCRVAALRGARVARGGRVTGVVGLARVVLAAVPVCPCSPSCCGWTATRRSRRTCWPSRSAGAPAWPRLGALVLNTAASRRCRPGGGDATNTAVVVAPVVEEALKGLGVLAAAAAAAEFDGVVDGIVYAGFVGVGFAYLENVLYLGRAHARPAAGGTAVVFVLRCLVSPFAHPLFTMAIGVGVAWPLPPPRRAAALAPVVGSSWPSGCTARGTRAVLGAGRLRRGVPAGAGPGVRSAVAVAGPAARRREARLIARHLSVYAATGWLARGRSRCSPPAGARGGPGGGRAGTGGRARAGPCATSRSRHRARVPAGPGAGTGRRRRTPPETEMRLLQTMWHLRAAVPAASAGRALSTGLPVRAPGRIRTCNLRIRRPLHCPLSYGGRRAGADAAAASRARVWQGWRAGARPTRER